MQSGGIAGAAVVIPAPDAYVPAHIIISAIYTLVSIMTYLPITLLAILIAQPMTGF